MLCTTPYIKWLWGSAEADIRGGREVGVCGHVERSRAAKARTAVLRNTGHHTTEGALQWSKVVVLTSAGDRSGCFPGGTHG